MQEERNGSSKTVEGYITDNRRGMRGTIHTFFERRRLERRIIEASLEYLEAHVRFLDCPLDQTRFLMLCALDSLQNAARELAKFKVSHRNSRS